jgi:hypothetical protein
MAYIERAYLTEQFENLLQDDNVMCPVMKVLDALEIIDTAPTADVVEVKHGKWETDRFGLERSICSICGAVFEGDGGNYCRKCGAKMDGERKENESN